MKDDLISRQSLMAHFATSQALVNDRDVLYCNGVLDVIAREPSVDAVPVVHGRWVYQKDGWYCSACKKKSMVDAVGFAKYCCRCGAKMDGGAEIE